MIRRLSLYWRILAVVALFVLGFGVVVTLLAVRLQSDRLRSELVERGRVLTAVAAANATDALVLLEVQELRQMLGELRAQSSVVDALAFDEECRVLTDGTFDNHRRHQKIDEAACTHAVVGEETLVDMGGEALVLTRPVRIGGELRGGVRVTFSLEALARERARLGRRTAMAGLLFVLLGVIVSAAVARTITHPLARLSDAFAVVSRGETPPPIPVEARDEVGKLVEAFNEMTRRLRETTVSRDYLSQVLRNMGEAIMVIEPDGRMRRVNPATCLLLGYPEGELEGRAFTQLLVGGSEPDPLADAFARRESAQGIASRLRSRTGDVVPVLASFSVMRRDVGELEGFVCIARDQREVLRAERLKDDFLSMVNHELRTPLTSIRGSLGLLKEGVAGPLGDEALDLVELADRNGERLQRLVDDLLDSHMLEVGEMPFRFEETEIGPILSRSVDVVRGLEARYGIRFQVDLVSPQARVRVDADRLEQVLVNLLSNAARHAPSSTVVRLAQEPCRAGLRISVSDSGPGIPVEFRPRVFDKFSQAESPDHQRSGGTGLGLAISRAIVTRLGGEIGFDAEEGHGTTFWVDLPIVG